jgi:predicted dehydrogenase
MTYRYEKNRIEFSSKINGLSQDRILLTEIGLSKKFTEFGQIACYLAAKTVFLCNCCRLVIFAAPMANLFRIGLIGCGLRGVWYLHTFRQAAMPFKLVAVADPDTQYAQVASRIFSDGQAEIFRTGEDLLDSAALDGVIIASPNHCHREASVKAMRRGVKFLLEKPVAASLDDMAMMWRAHVETGQEPIVGFCLRYAPFYRKIQEICASGALGKILTINAEELMSDDLSLVFARGDWRPSQTKSGGLMAEKCSHDMDILNWLAGSESELVTSFARRTFLTPRVDAGARCGDCEISSTCRFVHGTVPKIFEAEWPVELHEVLQKLEDDTCVFSARHTYPDHQVLSIQYKNGILCNFTVAQCQPATRRTIHVIGSEARLYGVLNYNEISVYRRGKPGSEVAEVIRVNPDTSGHNGGDSVLTQDFFGLLRGDREAARPGLREGIEASLLSLAADQSAELVRPVRLEALRQQVLSSAPSIQLVMSP